MSLYSDEMDKHYILNDFENKLKRKSNSWSAKSVKSEEDKRARREVANNNERRRMQSINTGFENLRKLLPYSIENEKLSKASILQTTSKYIQELITKINGLENDLLRMSSKNISEDSSLVTNLIKEVDKKIESNPLILEPKPGSISGYISDLGSSSSSLTIDNLSNSTLSLKSCDTEIISSMLDSSTILENAILDCSQSQNTLEHLLAAVAQVERQEAMKSKSTTLSQSLPNLDDAKLTTTANTTFLAMKPTISPFAEMIIQDVNNMQKVKAFHATSLDHLNTTAISTESINTKESFCSNNRSSKIAIPHKYLHRPNVVLSRCKN